MRSSRTTATFVICVDNEGYPASLEVCKVYRALSAQGAPKGWLRIVDESGDDYLYPHQRFVAIDLPPKARRALKGTVKASPAASRKTASK